MTYVFNYLQFFNYYANSANLKHDISNANLKVHYYLDHPYPITIPQQVPNASSHPVNYVEILGKRVYVKINKGCLYFSSIKFENGLLWDNHFHVGLRQMEDRAEKKKFSAPVNITVVFFHKTTQMVKECGKKHKNCYIKDGTTVDVRNIALLRCVQTTHDFMQTQFPDAKEQKIIGEIMSRPWLGIQCGGQTRKIFTGTRGGQYTIKHKRKIYLKGVVNTAKPLKN